MKTLLLIVAAGGLLHISPTVTLVKRQDAIERLLGGADQVAPHEVRLSAGDSRRLYDIVGWRPVEGALTFYAGRRQEQLTGVLLFMRVDSPHGPLELAVGFDPNGTVRDVVVTKATVETKPWVNRALRAGLTDAYRGLANNGTPAGATKVKNKVGSMPAYMAGLVDKGVARSGAAYRMFYRP